MGQSVWVRFARRLGIDRNPLRRWTDHAQTWIMAGLLATFLIGAPLAAVIARNVEHSAGQQALQIQQTWHRVRAVLREDAPGDGSFVYGAPAIEWVRAQWSAPDGSARSGHVPVAAGTKAGTTARVWVNRAGRVMGIPVTRAEIGSRMLAAAVLAPIVLAVLLLSTAVVARGLLDRRRLTEWEQAWTSIEPQWSGRC